MSEVMKLCDFSHHYPWVVTVALFKTVKENKLAYSESWSACLQGRTNTLHSDRHSYVPPGTAIYIPLHALQRSPEYFSPYPNTFWPDRWLQEDQRHEPFSISQEDQQTVISPDTIPPVHIHLPAFIPFSAGPANCAGKNLALVEMRMVIALLIQRFEMRFEDGYDASEWEKSLEEWFLLVTGKLPIVFQRRL